MYDNLNEYLLNIGIANEDIMYVINKTERIEIECGAGRIFNQRFAYDTNNHDTYFEIKNNVEGNDVDVTFELTNGKIVYFGFNYEN